VSGRATERDLNCNPASGLGAVHRLRRHLGPPAGPHAPAPGRRA
jgi:hypothetical protein